MNRIGDVSASDDILILDEPTLKDLEVFEAASGENSLFHFCNFAVTEGGVKVLKHRMANPWSSAARIRATQAAIKSILEHPTLFSKLPTAYTVNRVEHYSREVLPIVTADSLLEFSIGAFSLWANHDRHYLGILRGVQVGCRLVSGLRLFVREAEQLTLDGELVQLVAAMSALLSDDHLDNVPQNITGARFWKVLRLDQAFRIHHKDTIARLLRIVYEIDALKALAQATENYGFVLPEVKDGVLRVDVEGLVHPFVPNAVPNAVQLNDERHILFLTGPNMAGKTTYLRAFATALYLAQLGMGVPATRFAFVPTRRLFSSFSLSDDLRGGISYFRAEALRVKSVAEALAAGDSVVALMDEPFKGTNVKDAYDASLAILNRFSEKKDCLFMFSSHLIELSERLADAKRIDCRYFEAKEGEGRLQFDYQLRAGVSDQRLGMRVLEEEGVFELLDGAK